MSHKSAKKCVLEKSVEKEVVQLYRQIVDFCFVFGSPFLAVFLFARSSTQLRSSSLGGLLGELDAQDEMSVTVTVHLLACNGGV